MRLRVVLAKAKTGGELVGHAVAAEVAQLDIGAVRAMRGCGDSDHDALCTGHRRIAQQGSGASRASDRIAAVVRAEPAVTKPIARDRIYRRRSFNAEIIELCVRWYISYRLSYRDLVELTADRGVAVSHTTIMRWVIRYVPEFEKRWNRFARPVGRSWRVDETYIPVRGRRHYLYRAVDKQGKTVDFL